MGKMKVFFGVLAGLAVVFPLRGMSDCVLSGGEIINYERKILETIEGVALNSLSQKERQSIIKNVKAPLECLKKIQQSSNPLASLAARNSFYALFGSEGPPGIGIEEGKLFSRFALLMSVFAGNDPESAKWFEGLVSDIVKSEWATYKLFCVEGDTSHCLKFLPDEKDVSQEKDILASTVLLKWEFAHKTIPLDQKLVIEKRVKELYEKREEFSVLKRWFIERTYEKLIPDNSPLGFNLLRS